MGVIVVGAVCYHDDRTWISPPHVVKALSNFTISLTLLVEFGEDEQSQDVAEVVLELASLYILFKL